LLEVRTTSGNIFKNLLDTLKAVLNDANIIFSPAGLKLAAVDSKNNAFVHLVMEAEKFAFFHCKSAQLVLGIDINVLQKTIKTNKANDLLCFVVRKDDPSHLEITFHNIQKGERITDKIALLTLKESIIKDEIRMNLGLKISSQSFQNICREMVSFEATKIQIESTANELVFTNKLDGSNAPNGFTTRRVVISIDNTGDNDQSNIEYQPAKGVFDLKFLKSFAKAANLSPDVIVYLTNYSPIICEYSISGLGTLRYLLS
ncbi:hypothetical protein BDK51DRAFT_13714, partial [Blyttiomyces helicus]